MPRILLVIPARSDGGSSGRSALRFSSVGRRARHFSRGRRCQLRELPCFLPNPPFHIAGRPYEVVLQFHFHQAPIPRLPQAVASDSLTLRAFNGITMFHPFFEGIGLLLLPPGLEKGVVLADQERAVALILAQALAAQWALMTVSALEFGCFSSRSFKKLCRELCRKRAKYQKLLHIAVIRPNKFIPDKHQASRGGRAVEDLRSDRWADRAWVLH